VDVTKILEKDHRQVEKLFSMIEKAEGDGRTPLIDELVTALRGHMALEEAVLYPVMGPVTGPEDVQEGNAEHELARTGLEDVIRLAPDEPGFGAALDAVKAGIEHHVDEEEDDIFPTLRKDGTEVLERIALPFMKKRLALGLPMEDDAVAAANQ
jgi:hemerythrin-like domain-containing protein